jgi:vacuolar-type H+-ATPase catalytic subunit A/Vma1
MLMTKRILCLNGMLGDLKVAMSVQKHKGLISAERSITPMQIGSEVYLQNKELYNNMASEKITRQVVEEFFDKYLCKNKYSNTNKYKDDTNKKRLENLMHIYSDNTFHLGNTKWALYNALTFWASHPDKTNDVRQSTLNSTASLIDKRTKREGEIRSVLNKTNNLELVG